MNKIVKQAIIEAINQNTIADKFNPGISRTYTLSNKQHPEFMTIINSFGTKTYEIWLNNKTVLLFRYTLTDAMMNELSYRYTIDTPMMLDSEYAAFVEIVNCCNKKIMRQHKEKQEAHETEAARKSITEKEKSAVAFLKAQKTR